MAKCLNLACLNTISVLLIYFTIWRLSQKQLKKKEKEKENRVPVMAQWIQI